MNDMVRIIQTYAQNVTFLFFIFASKFGMKKKIQSFKWKIELILIDWKKNQ